VAKWLELGSRKDVNACFKESYVSVNPPLEGIATFPPPPASTNLFQRRNGHESLRIHGKVFRELGPAKIFENSSEGDSEELPGS
jgi:hypothetical protein